MDYLSSGYRCPVKIREGSDDTIMIRWYRAAPGARTFEAPHAFGSSVYDPDWDEPNEGVGTLPQRLEHNSSVLPVYPGTEDMEHPEYLLHGLPEDLPIVECWDVRLAFSSTWSTTEDDCLMTEDGEDILTEDGAGCIQIEAICLLTELGEDILLETEMVCVTVE